MSTPEARLSAAERAALADLETAATAADPHLAARLRGGAPSRALPVLVTARDRVLAGYGRVLGAGWWGVPILAVGLFLVVIGVANGFPISVAGLLVAATGLRVLAEMLDRRGLVPERPRRRFGPDA